MQSFDRPTERVRKSNYRLKLEDSWDLIMLDSMLATQSRLLASTQADLDLIMSPIRGLRLAAETIALMLSQMERSSLLSPAH